MVYIKYLQAFICAFIIVFLLIPQIAKVSKKIGFVDIPNKRKIHTNPVPQLGSIGIFVGFFLTYIIFNRTFNSQIASILIGSTLILLIGTIDDWYKTKGKDFPALPKLIIQIIAAIIVYNSGIVFKGFTNPMTKKYILLPIYLQFFLSVTWIFGVTTVINFVDGMDGLASSICSISSITLFVVALAKNQVSSAMLSIILTGVCIAYLQYNKPPAKIYMGDGGATFLGFMLGIISLDGAFKQTTMLSLLIPFLALGVPIFDNLFVIIKRFIDGKPIYKADRTQLHYRLLSKGLTPPQAVIFICLISLCLALSSIIILLIS